MSARGKDFRHHVQKVVGKRKPLKGRLAVLVELHPPDRRVRDIDNTVKSTLDALEHAGAFENDSQVDVLLVMRREAGKHFSQQSKGCCVVSIFDSVMQFGVGDWVFSK